MVALVSAQKKQQQPRPSRHPSSPFVAGSAAPGGKPRAHSRFRALAASAHGWGAFFSSEQPGAAKALQKPRKVKNMGRPRTGIPCSSLTSLEPIFWGKRCGSKDEIIQVSALELPKLVFLG